MTRRQLHTLSWLAGVFGLGVLVWYIEPAEFARTFRSVGVAGVSGWLVFQFAARLLMIEVTVRPVRALGFSLARAEAFWIGWVRTFSNQVVPFAGLAYYAHRLRQSSGIPWTQLAALSSMQLLLAAAGIGLIGLLATVSNLVVIGNGVFPTLAAFGLLASASLLIALRPGSLMDRMPGVVRRRARRFFESVSHLARHPGLVLSLTLVQCAIILLQGGRLLVLFMAVGVPLDWHEALLVLVIAEATALFQITPGGLGLREGAIVGAALLLEVSPEVAASVALIDRLLTVSVTTLLAAPAIVQIYRNRPA